MKRRELSKTYRIDEVRVGPDFVGLEIEWLVNQAKQYSLPWFLAHADDGVIWGEIRGGSLALSGDVFDQVSPRLRALTLQQARLFGPDGELLLWRTAENSFTARLLVDEDSAEPDCLEEVYLLWGDHCEKEVNGFTLLAEGRQGLRHAPPLTPADRERAGAQKQRAALTIRHYLAYDDDGQAYIKMSRLVDLNNGGQHG